jgi:acyl-CoA synthetase (AMP-forming)/AMP-acid ligase II
MIHTSPGAPIEIPDVSLAAFILEHADARGDAPALIEGPTGRVVTYEAFARGVREVARDLQLRGIRKGDVVAIWSPNVPEYAMAFHGVSLAGATNTTANALYTPEELRFQLVDSGARLLLTIPPFLDRAREAARGTEVEAVLLLDELLGNDGAYTPVAIDPARDLVTLPYSSGTTGFPKGVMLTHRNLIANIVQFAAYVPTSPDDCVPAVLPFFHIYGQTVILNMALRYGARIVTMPRFDLEGFLTICQEHRATTVYVAPPVVLALAKHPLVERYDLSSFRFIVSGAAPLDADLQSAATARLGRPVAQGYGLTETSPVTHLSVHLDTIEPGTIGTLLPESEARIVDVESGLDAAPGAPGELWVRGPHVMAGYLNNAEATAATIDADGFLHTGDIATVDGHGVFRIVDRLKELIKYKGYQVPPAELEGALLAHPDCADACVVGVRDQEAGELPKAFIVRTPGAAATVEEIAEAASSRLAPHKRIRLVEEIDAIPKSPSGKLLRRVLAAR